MTKIVLLNAHTELWFGKSLYFFAFRRPWKAKYLFFSKIQSKHRHLYIISSKNRTILWHAIEYLHVKIWAFANGLNLFNVRLLHYRDVSHTDIMLVQYIGNFTSYDSPVSAGPIIEFLNAIHCKKYLMMNHHPYHVKVGVENLNSLNYDGLILESKLDGDDTFYNKFFETQFQTKKTVIMPFAVREEFFNAFRQRQFTANTNTCLCVGTESLDMSHDKFFVDYFGHGDLQPLRKKIRAGMLSHLPLKNHVSHINDGGQNMSARKATNIYNKVKAVYHNAFKYGQRSYHKKNIVKLFLSSNFHIVGEEVTGLPGISAFEGMATGSILIGICDGTYERFGMKAGIHYIAHDGTLASIERALSLATQMDKKDLINMSNAAYNFALSQNSQQKVYQHLMRDLQCDD